MNVKNDEWLIEEFVRLVVEKSASTNGQALLDALKKGVREVAADEMKKISSLQREVDTKSRKGEHSPTDELLRSIATSFAQRNDIVRLQERVEELARGLQSSSTVSYGAVYAAGSKVQAPSKSTPWRRLCDALPAAILSSVLTASLFLIGDQLLSDTPPAQSPVTQKLPPTAAAAIPLAATVEAVHPAQKPIGPSSVQAVQQSAEFKALLALEVTSSACRPNDGRAATLSDCVRSVGIDPVTLDNTTSLLTRLESVKQLDGYSNIMGILLQAVARGRPEGAAIGLDGKLGPKTLSVLKKMPCVDKTLFEAKLGAISLDQHATVAASIARCWGLSNAANK
jgi:hypothetical protein